MVGYSSENENEKLESMLTLCMPDYFCHWISSRPDCFRNSSKFHYAMV